MAITMMTYVGLVAICARKFFVQVALRDQERIFKESALSQKLANQKASLDLEKTRLENETSQIFTLYEIMKEITQSLSEKEAFEIFKKKLNSHIVFTQCLLVDPLCDALGDYKKSSHHFIFTLQGQSDKIGYLVIEGIPDEYKEKLMILGHQFALALRRIKLYNEIEHTATTDDLTELCTRRYATERFQEELKRANLRHMNLSFAMIDVDHFKILNDQQGHLAGDQILREVGRLIRDNIREIDIAARFGGEEFCVILPDTNRAEASYTAERIRQAVERATITVYDAQIKVTVSLGISTYPEDGTRMEELIDKADWALYRAKRQGRNCICSFGLYPSS